MKQVLSQTYSCFIFSVNYTKGLDEKNSDILFTTSIFVSITTSA